MPAKFVNQARMNTSTVGTGTLTLTTAVPPFNTFATAGVIDGDVVAYSIIDGTTNSEKGWGLYTAAGTTLTRNVFQSTNANNPINLSGNAQVFIDPSSTDLVPLALGAHANLGGI